MKTSAFFGSVSLKSRKEWWWSSNNFVTVIVRWYGMGWSNHILYPSVVCSWRSRVRHMNIKWKNLFQRLSAFENNVMVITWKKHYSFLKQLMYFFMIAENQSRIFAFIEKALTVIVLYIIWVHRYMTIFTYLLFLSMKPKNLSDSFWRVICKCN